MGAGTAFAVKNSQFAGFRIRIGSGYVLSFRKAQLGLSAHNRAQTVSVLVAESSR